MLEKLRGKAGIDSFRQLFLILRDQDLFKEGPEQRVNLQNVESLRNAIMEASGKLPGLYQDTYVAPLLRNIEQTRKRCSDATMETLCGAVYGHNHPEKECTDGLRGLLAVMSNVYRSFLTPEFGIKTLPPQPRVIIPSLVTFRPKLYLDSNPPEYAPFVLPANEVERLCGAKVGVVTIPSNYRAHPALYWGTVAHEVGGHDVLNAYDGLLWEMSHHVRELFYKEEDPKGDKPENEAQFLGLLWQYWTEEAASDVCAIMNLGPAYAMGVAVYLAALNERIQRYKNGDRRKGDEPILTTSWPPSPQIPDINYHPTDILKLYVMIGAIQGLRMFDQERKDQFTKFIADIVNDVLAESGEKKDTIEIRGWMQFKPGRWVRVDDGAFPMKRSKMQECARNVGNLIATQSYKALNGNGLQGLETWTDSDQIVADQNCALTLANSMDQSVGDDAQLVAGAIIALFFQPQEKFYRSTNIGLINCLKDSFESDPIWGTESYHAIASGQSSVRQKKREGQDFPRQHG